MKTTILLLFLNAVLTYFIVIPIGLVLWLGGPYAFTENLPAPSSAIAAIILACAGIFLATWISTSVLSRVFCFERKDTYAVVGSSLVFGLLIIFGINSNISGERFDPTNLFLLGTYLLVTFLFLKSRKINTTAK
jgi:hypothetical protein